MNILLFCTSLFLKTVVAGLNINLIYFIDPYPTSTFVDLTKSDVLYSHIYYYTIIVFFCSFIVHNFFLINSIIKVKNRKKYWKKMFSRFMFHYIFANQFIWVYYICKGDHVLSPKTFLNFEIIYSLIYFHMFGRLLLAHNKLLGFINSKNAGMILNRENTISIV